MVESDSEAVIGMMRVFYRSPAVLSDGSEEIFRSDFENCINDSPYLEGFVFEQDESIIGYAMTAKSFSTEFGKPCIWIEDIYIEPTYRGLGIGSEFFRHLERRYNNAVFRLEAENENERAVAVYKKNGYEVLPYLELIKKDKEK